MKKDLIAHVSIVIHAPPATVWDALTNPAVIKQYMFGTTVVSDWKQGSTIVWKGEWQGQKYEDRGVILSFESERLIRYSHFSPLSGKPDLPENYHIVTIRLSRRGDETFMTLTQDNNIDENSRKHSEENWNAMFVSLKRILESKP